MFILTKLGREDEGAYSVQNEEEIRYYISLKMQMMQQDML